MMGQRVTIGTIRTRKVSAFNQIHDGRLRAARVGVRRRYARLAENRTDYKGEVLSPVRYAPERSSFPGVLPLLRRTPFTHTPCTPTGSVVSRACPPGRSCSRRFGPRSTFAGSKRSRSAQ